ncbi:putative mitochondrial inner membrane translocase subunit protein [Botrytis fragariae]|uniref:Mitochondrial import inner membrane translocase subunit TIM44 n=1 Tax=Botrytis fragariae TaxID=1964551 RepID=A0A8H6AHC0_9HELO|nr:putative mitochondrial inner membrane translocase subunit protein [Botrytis fragariae]KAF5867460.1 putative mitochondrial inner membrane translocase subunit protein [Botrytis fragariae]
MNGLRTAATRTPTSKQVSLSSITRPSSNGSTLRRQIVQQSRNLQFSTAGSSRSATLSYPAPLRSRFLPEEIRSVACPASSRHFHESSRLGKEKKTKPVDPADPAAKEEATEEEPSKKESAKDSESTSGEDKAKEEGEGNKTPWQVFTETLQTEFKASKEWNESTKQLAEGAHQFTENENVKRARQAFESTTGAVTSTTGKVLKTTAGAVGKGAAWTWETPVVKGVRTTVNATANVLDKATQPIRQTEAYKNVKNVIDDGSSSRYGGWVEKEERRKARELRELQEGATGKTKEVPIEDPNAGTNVTLHKDSAYKEAWRDFRDSNRVMQSLFSMKTVYNESENPLISTARSISDRVAGFFAENETAQVIKKFREMDPSFQMEPFLREMREYILPEVLDAYVKGDTETLKLWLSAAQFSVYDALSKQYTTAGLKSDGRILDIRHVEVLSARMLDNDIPVFIITCRTQEVHVYRNAKTNQLAAGMEDKVQLVTYAIGVTRVAEDVNNPETRGWRLIELQKSGRDYI